MVPEAEEEREGKRRRGRGRGSEGEWRERWSERRVVLAGVGGDAAEREVDGSGVGRLVAWRLDGLEKGKGGSMVALAGVIARVRLQDVLAEVARWARTVSLEKMNRWRLMFF